MAETASGLAAQGIAALEARQYNSAAALFLAAARLDPSSAELLFNAGLSRLREGRVSDAKKLFERCLAFKSLSPKLRADIACNMGLCCFDTGKTEEAERLYCEALELFPHHSEAANNEGVVLFQRGDYAGAKKYFELALRGRPDYSDAALNLADTEAELKNRQPL